MGLGGAFLTGDLFNLFVFFEVTLAASYGLLLHGSGAFRVRSGLHYISINLAASLLFLIGVSLIYGVTGTLSMADLALRIPEVRDEDRMLLQAGAAILGVAFLVKAGMWPLGFWLPSAYMAAAAPVGAIFVILTKVGVYVLLRLSLLLFGSPAGELMGFGGVALLWGGMATLAFATSGVLASQAMGRLAGYSVLISSGTLLAAVGMGDPAVVSGALFYLVSSTFSTAALFMLIELVERAREPGADLLAVTMEAYGEERDETEEPEDEEVGVVMPARARGTRRLLRMRRSAARGPAATLGLRREVRPADRHAEPRRIGERDRDPGAHLAAGRAGHPVRPGGTGRDDANWHPDLLGPARDHRPARSGDGSGSHPGAPGALSGDDSRGRCDDQLYGRRCARVARAAQLHPERSRHAERRQMSRVLPYPLLAAALLLMWMLLTSFSAGQFLLGGVVAMAASRVMAALQPSKPRLRGWQLIPRLVGIVALDILRSNAAVASIILQGGRHNRVSGFVAIPLDLRDKTGLAVLACIVTSTPGTAWIEYAPDSGILLIHVLDLVDKDEWVALIKNRYEALLMEIFE